MKSFQVRMILPMFFAVFAISPFGAVAKDTGVYTSFGKRDPFSVPSSLSPGGAGGSNVDPLRRFRLEGYKLRAILRVGSQPQAMFEDPDGNTHVVTQGQTLGQEGARVSRIVNSEVIVTERSLNNQGNEVILERILSLPGAQPANQNTTSLE